MFRKALLVGIEHYEDGTLPGCVRDVQRLFELLTRHADDSPNFECVALVSRSETDPHAKVGTESLKSHLQRLFLSGADQCEIALFYFSGHGKGSEEGGFLVTQDSTEDAPGLPMDFLIDLANQSNSREVILILDCCHAGFLVNREPFRLDTHPIRKGVSLLTSSDWNQNSVSHYGGSQFTSILIAGLEGGAGDLSGAVTITGLHYFCDRLLGAFQQRPIFKTFLGHMAVLRFSSPLVSTGKLRLLSVYWPHEDFEIPLGPEHEPTVPPYHPQKEGVFRDLQLYYSVGLVRPVGEEFMYFAAINRKVCKLTVLGRYYWRMAKEGRL